jgi:hypothetical protein
MRQGENGGFTLCAGNAICRAKDLPLEEKTGYFYKPFCACKNVLDLLKAASWNCSKFASHS